MNLFFYFLIAAGLIFSDASYGMSEDVNGEGEISLSPPSTLRHRRTPYNHYMPLKDEEEEQQHLSTPNDNYHFSPKQPHKIPTGNEIFIIAIDRLLNKNYSTFKFSLEEFDSEMIKCKDNASNLRFHQRAKYNLFSSTKEKLLADELYKFYRDGGRLQDKKSAYDLWKDNQPPAQKNSWWFRW
ncbi:MAG: hypothetical protein K0M45_03370 [Candidatus Paracaedibacteraceae bacterium]|nr:hypothetical protein [Candidatus Paracaedibacteraceae bacterium]